jgi:hypothetical protein
MASGMDYGRGSVDSGVHFRARPIGFEGWSAGGRQNRVWRRLIGCVFPMDFGRLIVIGCVRWGFVFDLRERLRGYRSFWFRPCIFRAVVCTESL